MMAVALSAWAGREGSPPEMAWLVLLSTVALMSIWTRYPGLWAVVFVGGFVVQEFFTPEQHYGSSWIMAYAFCVDANTRRPVWIGATVGTALTISEVVLGWSSPADVLANVMYFGLLALVGQFIRLAFAGSRAQREAAELRRQLDRQALIQAVHDSVAARLTQILLVARGLRSGGDPPETLGAHLDTVIDVASAAADELRKVVHPLPPENVEFSGLAREWARSQATLRAGGFQLAGSCEGVASVGPGPVADEAVRCIEEATANICRHGVPGGRVVCVLMADEDHLVLSWINDVVRDLEAVSQTRTGLGLAGMKRRVAGRGGWVTAGPSGGMFTLRVEIPLEPGPGRRRPTPESGAETRRLPWSLR